MLEKDRFDRSEVKERARELTRGLEKIFKDRDKCATHEANLVRDIDSLDVINRARSLGKSDGNSGKCKNRMKHLFFTA